MQYRTLLLASTGLLLGACAQDAAPPGSVLSARVGLSGITHNYDGSEQAWRELLDGARQANATFLHLQAPPWSEAETSPGVFDLSYFDAFVRLNSSYNLGYTLDVSTPLGLGAVDLPADLAFSSFGDPALMARYDAYVSAVLTRLSGASHVILHTETAGPYFGNDEKRADFLAYCDLVAHAADHVRAVLPGVKVGVYGTKNESPGILSCLNRATDFFGISYIADRGDDEHRARLAELAGLSGGKPIALFEAGVPTAARLGGSESRQVDFVRLLFEFAAQQGESLLLLSYFQYIDEDPALTRQYVPILFAAYDPEQQEDFIAFFTSLGLLRTDGSPKPAWQEFVTRGSP
jgi:hypothetical protein